MAWRIFAERVRRYEEEFRKCVARIIERYGGRVTVVLFGSRARGTHDPSSDFDILVVVERVGDYFEEAAAIRSLCRGAPVDVVLFEKSSFVLDGVMAKMLESCAALHDGLEMGLCRRNS